MKTGFIGAGNMASSLIGGLIADGTAASDIVVFDTSAERLQAVSSEFGVETSELNAAFIEQLDVLVLAVKPQVMRQACEQIMAVAAKRFPLVVSVAAGLPADKLASWLWTDVALVRAMPNTPALIQAGATGLYANVHVDDAGRSQAERIMRAAGLVVWVDQESDMDLVTALSGSGPAYYFLVMEAMQEAACDMGLPAETARILTLQTALGSARLAMESSDDAATLRHKVTSPGGTTEQALNVFLDNNFKGLFAKAMQAAADRARTLASEIN